MAPLLEINNILARRTGPQDLNHYFNLTSSLQYKAAN